MSLSADLKKVLTDNISDNGEEMIVLTEFQQKKVKQLAEGMTDAIIDWLTAQTFTIVDMKAMVEIEKLSTAGPLQADVLPSVTVVTSGGPGNVAAGTNGVMIPPIKLQKIGGQGSRTDSLGYAYIGDKTPNGETNENLTKVKLLEDNIVER